MIEGVQVPKCLNLLEPGPGPASVGCARAASLLPLPSRYLVPPLSLARSLSSASSPALSCFGWGPGQTWRGLAYSGQRPANTLFWPCTSWCQRVVCHPSPEPVPPPNLRDPDCPTPLRARGNTVFGKCYVGRYACIPMSLGLYVFAHSASSYASLHSPADSGSVPHVRRGTRGTLIAEARDAER